jgi:hypothetical protein
MESNTQPGNRVILLIIAATLAVSSLFVNWGTITLTSKNIRESIITSTPSLGLAQLDEMFSDLLQGMVGHKVPVTGMSGRLVAGPVVVPYWVTVTTAILGLLMLATNVVRFSSVPRWVIGALLLSAASMAGWALFVIMANGTIQVGILLFATAIGIGLFQLARTETALANQ